MNNNYKKSNSKYIVFILMLIAGFCFFEYFSYTNHQKQIYLLNEQCTPVSTAKEEKELPLDSIVVKELYKRVSTDIREDLASPTIDDKMKLYLALRQVPQNEFYDSNCNLFSNANMSPYTCKESLNFTPKAIKEDTIQLQLKKLFGEQAQIANSNIQLGANCIGGYQYIEKRGEYVEGECSELTTTTLKAKKSLVKAISKESTIKLIEEVKYYGNEGKQVPNTLVSGTYIYTFKLDTNYNYIFIDKQLQQ